LETAPFGLAVVTVSSDMKGDSDKDRELTQARAMIIRDYLVQNFKLDDTKVKTLGLGKSPDVNEGSRIDVIVYGPVAGGSRSAGQADRSVRGSREQNQPSGRKSK